MPEAGWAIRFLEGNNYTDKGTIDFASNYGENARTLDNIIVYSGLYGIDDYLVWFIHKNIPSYDFSTVALNLRLTLYKNTEAVYFQDFYRVQDVKYDANKSKFVLYAVSEGSLRLHKKLINYKVKSLSYKENRKAKDVIRDIIEKNKIFYVVFHEDDDSTKNLPHYEYRYFDIDIEWTVLDFIQYICNDNMYEWCIDKLIGEDNVPHYILHIGHVLKPYLYRNATKPYEREKDNISATIYGFKITTEPSPMNILSHWEETHKCIWVRHSAGRGGGISRGYFIKLGQGHFNTRLYLNSLEGDIEKDIGFSILKREKRRFPSITLGNILKDEGDEYIDEVSLQRNPNTYTVREPHNVIINRGDDLAVQHQLEKITRSTPYLDHNAGLFFPSPKLDNSPPNSIVFSIDGKRESAVLGPYVLGDGRVDENGNRTLIIPIKNRDDFRFRLPNGGEIYYKSAIGETETGSWIFQAPVGFTFKTNVITDPGEIPNELRIGGEEQSSTITFHDNYFTIEGPISLLSLREDGDFLITPSYDSSGQNAPRYAFYLRNISGEIILHADNNIDIEIRSEGTLTSGTITINTTGTINVGNDATVIRLAGGGNKISHGDHIHEIPPGPAIPGPPVFTSTHSVGQSSDITEVD